MKLNDLNKCRDAVSAEGFAGYSLFQNLIVGGQDKDGMDVTNDLSFMCITASAHVFLPQPSLSIRCLLYTSYYEVIRLAIQDRDIPDVCVVKGRENLKELVRYGLVEDLTQVYEDCTCLLYTSRCV